MNPAPWFRSGAAALLTPLDRLRWLLLKLLGPLARSLVRRRELRVLAAGCSVVGISLAATVISPFWLLALGPVVLGVPHLLADVRYLVLRPGLHRRHALWLPVGAPLLLAGTSHFSMPSGLAACAAMALMARGAWTRKVIALLCIGGLMTAVLVMGDAAALVFAHLHNFIAVMLWWCWRPRCGQRWQAVVPLLFLIASGMLALGWLQPWAHGIGWQPARLGPEYHLAFLAPGIAEPWALRLVLLFAFAQSVHYGVWLRLIPEDDRPQETSRTFRASARALVADAGMPLTVFMVLLSLGIALWAVFDLTAARENYLRMALFHGYLELIAATWLFVERPTRLEAGA
jgi:hypothetical protein